MDTEKLRILISDDEEHVRELLSEIAAYLECNVIGQAANGEEAVDLYKKEQPDIMFLDINMPIKSGDEVLEELFKEFPEAYIIILTAISDMQFVEKCMSLGAAHFILKDIPMPKMVSIIKELLNNFKNNKKKITVEKFDLIKMMEEIKEDENIYYSNS